MERCTDGAQWDAHAYEAVLDLPFNSEAIAPSSPNTEYDIVDVRRYAHDVVLGAAERFTAMQRETAANTTFDPEKVRHVAAVQNMLGDGLGLLRRYVHMADNLAEASNDLRVEQHEKPWLQARANYQYTTISGIIDSLQKVRLPHNQPTPPIDEVLQTGVIAVAPTGFGKTFVAARVLEAAGIGRRVDDMTGKLLSALVVVPSVELVHQSTRDESNIFRQVIGYDVPIGKYWAYDKDIKPVTVMTQRSLILALEQGVIGRGYFDMMIFDEAHHATAPETFKAVQRVAGGMVGLTATPAYNEQKDVRKWFPHVKTGTLRQFAEEGILSSARLLTFQESETQSAVDIAVSLAAQYVSEGRQLIIYTRKGGRSVQARVVAARLNEVMERQVACAVGQFAGGRSQDPIEAYRRGDIRVLTTTRMLREGFDAPVDAMISVGPHYSDVDLTQKAGRAMRPGKFEAVLVEIWPKQEATQRMVTLATVFGIENYTQGMRIGGRDAWPQVHKSRNFIADVPQIIQPSLASPQVLRSILIGPEVAFSQEIPSNHIVLAELAEMYQTHERHLELLLRRAEISGIGITAKYGRMSELMMWYGPDAIEYLDANPPLKPPSDAFMSPAEICELTGVSRTYLDKLRKKRGFTTQKRLSKGAYSKGYFDKETTGEILDIIDNIAFAELDDVPIGTMSPEIAATFILTYCEKHKIEIITKRRNEEHGIKGFTAYLSAEDAAKVRQAYQELTTTDALISFNEIAAQAGINYATIKVRLTLQEQGLVIRRYVQTDSKRRMAYHLPEDIAQQVIERLRVKELPAHVLSVKAIEQRLSRKSSSVHNYITALGEGHEPVTGNFKGQPGTRAAYYAWATLEAIERTVLPPLSALPLQYGRLTPEAITQKHNQLYARIMQSYYMDTIDDSEVYVHSEIAKALQCSDAALKLSLERVPGAVESLRYKQGQQTLALTKVILPIITHAPHRDKNWVSHQQVIDSLAASGYNVAKVETALKKLAPNAAVLGSINDYTDVYYPIQALRDVTVALETNWC